MSKREKIIDSFKYDDDKNLAAKLIDLIEQVQKYYEPRFTDFLDPAQVNKAKRVIGQFHDIKDIVSSCVEGCERNIIAIYPDNFPEDDIKIPIVALSISGKSRFENLNHRDVLGALMNLGLKREKIGDIIINGESCHIIVNNDISYYIVLNLDKIKHTPVKADYAEFSDITRKQDKHREIAASVASLRLDSVLSCGFGESRSSIVQEISKGNVKVNWEEVTTPSYGINEGDTISLRGRGRIRLEKVEGVSRKGRIHIILIKFN